MKGIDCPLCGAVNKAEATQCRLCQTSLVKREDTAPLERVDASTARISPRRLLLTLLLLSILALPWVLLSDLFSIPQEIAQTRQGFNDLRARYLRKEEKWLQQKNQVLAVMRAPLPTSHSLGERLEFDDLPLEVLMAYAEDDLSLSPERFGDLAWYPSSDLRRPTFVLSKYESQRWSLPVLLSLELELVSRGDRTHFEFRRLRRGTRDVAQGLAWVYFGAELKALRQIEELVGGMSHLHLSYRKQEARANACDPIFISWQYHYHPPIRTSKEAL